MTWADDAACKGKDQRHWFPVTRAVAKSRAGRPDDPYGYARSICAGCPVKAECLDEALGDQPQGRSVEGMWGGLDEAERWALRRRTKPARKAPAHGTTKGYKQHGRLGEKACDACTEAKRASNGYTASKVAV